MRAQFRVAREGSWRLRSRPGRRATIEFDLINPITHDVIFSAGPQTGSWLTKRMDETSYTSNRKF